jgi:phosphoribosylformylglycinamidine synthase
VVFGIKNTSRETANAGMPPQGTLRFNEDNRQTKPPAIQAGFWENIDHMAAPRVCVLRAPGTNCDLETAFAFETSGAKACRVHLMRLFDQPDVLKDYQILCIPGGFSYGDDLGAGVIFSRQLSGTLERALGEFLQRDTLILGICNGFQVLLKAGILPNGTTTWPPSGEQPATLTWNDNGKYTSTWVKLKVAAPQNVFLKGLDELELPIAHAEGKLVPRDLSLIDQWQSRSQIALRYSLGPSNGQNGSANDVLPYPHKPNGSLPNIAGLSDPTGRVLGLMPHPERFLHKTQHPEWTRRTMDPVGTGQKLFQNAVDYFG